jgi:transposase InsO family protein
LRKQLIGAGLDAGAHTIAWHLEREGPTPPSPSTIWRILVRRGFVTPEPRKRPKSSYVRFEADQPNERWQADTTHWQLADHTDIEICNIIDDHSRLTIASVARTSFKAADIVEVFTDAFAVYGLPASVLTDNAAIFTGTPRGRGQVALEKLCATLDIRLHHSRAYHPQTCGKVERLHQTMKKWLTATDPAPTIGDLQTQLDTFTEVYNHHRPHRAINRRTPATAYTARTPQDPTTVSAPHTPAPPRCHQQRHRDPAPQQPAAPHRHRQSPHRHTRLPTGRRPAHPRHRRRHRAASSRPHPRPRPRLPTPRRPTRPTTPPEMTRCPETRVQHVPGHRSAPSAGFEPATYRLGGGCSIP